MKAGRIQKICPLPFLCLSLTLSTFMTQLIDRFMGEVDSFPELAQSSSNRSRSSRTRSLADGRIEGSSESMRDASSAWKG